MTFSDLQISIAGPAERGVLENLFQLYIHDFSQFWAGEARGELQNDGRFEAYPGLDAYWRDAGHYPVLVRKSGHLVGFALVRALTAPVLRGAHEMAEFFVVRKHRRTGIGAAAAARIYGDYPGAWETYVARRNTGALAFWRGVIGDHPRIGDVETLDLHPPDRDGTLFRFEVDAA